MPDDYKIGEPWYCCSCGYFMYATKFIDGDFYPVEGAPQSKFISTKYPRVCSVCFDLHLILDTSDYWKKLESTKRENEKKNKKLFPGENYFTA